MGTGGPFPGIKHGRGVTLTRSYTPLPPSAAMACSGTASIGQRKNFRLCGNCRASLERANGLIYKTHTHTHTHIYIYIYIYIEASRLTPDSRQTLTSPDPTICAIIAPFTSLSTRIATVRTEFQFFPHHTNAHAYSEAWRTLARIY
jgi:hypothetical protein